tara:strand:+ start:226 stop:939 length:714 start_codon:yes stop_codon:yes gene_type:complete
MGKVLRVTIPKGVRRILTKQMSTQANVRVLIQATKPEINKTIMPKMKKQFGQHYQNMLQSVQDFLDNPGVISIDKTGVRQVSVLGANGTRVRVKTGSWQKLGGRYAKRSPISKSFWRKGSNNAGYEQLNLLYKKAVQGARKRKKPIVRAESFPIKKSGNFELRYELDLGTLPFPLDGIMGEAFIGGKKTQISGFSILPKGGGRRDITRIAFPESKRPVISAIAARLGRDLRIALKNG